jgi:hypothetical protein
MKVHFFFPSCFDNPGGQGLHTVEVSKSHSAKHATVSSTPTTSDRPVAQTSTWQHNKSTTDISMTPVGFETEIAHCAVRDRQKFRQCKLVWNRDSSVGIATRYGQEISSYPKPSSSRPCSGTMRLPFYGYTGSFPGMKQLGRETDHSHLVPRLWTSGALPPHLLHDVTAWIWNLHFTYTYYRRIRPEGLERATMNSRRQTGPVSGSLSTSASKHLRTVTWDLAACWLLSSTQQAQGLTQTETVTQLHLTARNIMWHREDWTRFWIIPNKLIHALDRCTEHFLNMWEMSNKCS